MSPGGLSGDKLPHGDQKTSKTPAPFKGLLHWVLVDRSDLPSLPQSGRPVKPPTQTGYRGLTFGEVSPKT